MANILVGAGVQPITIRTIGFADLNLALRKGLDDFVAMPTYAIFVALIYPIIGIVLARLAFGYAVLPLIYPLASGFALVGPVAALGLYEMSRQREEGRDRTDQRKAAGERIDQRQHGIAEGEPRQHDADDGIDQRDEDRVRRHRDEVVEALAQREVQIGKADGADGDRLYAGANQNIGHRCPPWTRRPGEARRSRQRRGGSMPARELKT